MECGTRAYVLALKLVKYGGHMFGQRNIRKQLPGGRARTLLRAGAAGIMVLAVMVPLPAAHGATERQRQALPCTLSIATAQDFENIGVIPASPLNGHYCLQNDINLSTLTPFAPVGPTIAQAFTGTFDGQGHTIANLAISQSGTNPIGLFGVVGLGGTVENLHLTGVNVAGGTNMYVGGVAGESAGTLSSVDVAGTVSASGGSHVGGLAGLVAAAGSLSGSHNAATVSGTGSEVGGLVGANAGNITQSYNAGQVTNTATVAYVGGLVGIWTVGHLDQSYNSGAIVAGGNPGAGGLAGSAGPGTALTRSYNTGSVSGQVPGGSVGGLIGVSSATISQSYNTGAVSYPQDSVNVGGLVGDSANTISQSYHVGSVSGGTNANVGGLVGKEETAGPSVGTLTETYSAGSVSSSGSTVYVGGLIGHKFNAAADGPGLNFFDYTLCGCAYGTIGVGDQTSAMLAKATYVAWDFTLVWNINEGLSYPYFKWVTTPPLPPVPTATVTNTGTATASATITSTPATTTPTVTTTPVPVAGGTTDYFAEGFTGLAATNGRATFTEVLNVLNPSPSAANVTFTYYIQGTAAPVVVTRSVAHTTVLRESVNTDVGTDKIVAAMVTSPQRVYVTRTISRLSPTGARLDSSTTLPVRAAATSWGFPEGYTGVTFQEYLTVLNPTNIQANVTVLLAPQAASAAGAHTLSLTVPALSRITADIRGLNLASSAKSVGMLISSDQPIVAERVIYFGDGAGSGKFGSTVSSGIAAPSTALRFAFGSSSGAGPTGNQDFITLLNPSTTGNPVQVTASFSDAAGHPVGTAATVSVAPGTRQTIIANNALGAGAVSAFSVSLTATGPIEAESAQYFSGSPNIGQHPGVAFPAQVGAASDVFLTDLSTTLADNNATLGRSVYLYNPGSTVIQVVASYFGGNSANPSVSYTVPAGGIQVVDVDQDTQASIPPGALGGEFKLAAGSSGGFIAYAVGLSTDSLSATEDVGNPAY
jgi:hypothetical protein